MNLKKFFLDWRKIVIIVIVFLLTIFYNIRTETLTHPKIRYYQGFPFEWWIYEAGGIVTSYELFLGRIIITGFIVDLIIWYLVFCLIVWIYDKVKKK